MENTSVRTLDFTASSGGIRASLISTSKSSEAIAVALPGAGYSCKMPLLYYSINSLLLKGYQVLAIEKVYAEDSVWCNFKTRESAFEYVQKDSEDLFAEISRLFPERVKVLLGRSLGTLQIACALEQNIFKLNQIIWQTPSLYERWPLMKSCGVDGFGIIGTIDQRYETALPYLPKDRIVIDGADHAMEIPGDMTRSIEILGQVIAATHEWLQPAQL